MTRALYVVAGVALGVGATVAVWWAVVTVHDVLLAAPPR